MRLSSLKLTFIFYFLIFLQILDGVFTYIAVIKHGILVEGNPIVIFIISKLNPGLGLLLLKIFTILLILLIFRSKLIEKLTKALYLVTTFYFLVVTLWILILLEIVPLKL